jgi:Na+/proline symporter
MTFQPIDWWIVAGLVAVLTVAALRTRRHAQNVSGFLAANRCAGRYLISVAFNMAQLGVITLVWYFQQNYDVGWTSIWWQLMEGPAMIVIALTGWVIYRFRRTRALTLAQFFEMRYSKHFRVFAGVVAFLSGIINYGIFPGVAARYFIALCGLPEQLDLGIATVPTFASLMIALMGTALVFVFAGGQIAIMVTDFLQGVFSNVVFLAVIAFLLFTIPWGQFEDVLLGRVWQGEWVTADTGLTESGTQPPEGKSLIHPFKLGEEANFNVWYWLISVVVLFYGMRAWQGDQGYNAAARNPHEARMANILNGWRFRVLMLITIVLPLAIRVMLHHPDYVGTAEATQQALDGSVGWLGSDLAAEQGSALRSELRIPHGTAAVLPAGLLGLMGAAMLGAFISTNDTYLHSWAAIFVQDVVLPFRKRPLSTKAHLRLLRSAVFGVAVFAAAVLATTTSRASTSRCILALTGSGLRRRRRLRDHRRALLEVAARTQAAWTAMIVGHARSRASASWSSTRLRRRAGWPAAAMTPTRASSAGRCTRTCTRPTGITGQVLDLRRDRRRRSAATCIVSLLRPAQRDFDLDRLFHRGAYRGRRRPGGRAETRPASGPSSASPASSPAGTAGSRGSRCPGRWSGRPSSSSSPPGI